MLLGGEGQYLIILLGGEGQHPFILWGEEGQNPLILLGGEGQYPFILPGKEGQYLFILMGEETHCKNFIVLPKHSTKCPSQALNPTLKINRVSRREDGSLRSGSLYQRRRTRVSQPAVRFEKSRGEVCLGPGTNNEVNSARPLSDLWQARVA